MKDRFQKEIGAKELDDWTIIQWKLVKKQVRNLRQRIFRATQERKWNQAKSLMKLMLRSQANLLLSIKRVTQINLGKRTAGIDNQKALTNLKRRQMFHEMRQYTPWKAKPAKRVYIPKSNGKKRPLGIPVLKDRILQAVVKNALEPHWEAQFEATSYGFRPGRSTHDAIAHTHNRLREGHDTWVLEADIQGAFDNISHEYLLNTLGNLPGKELIRQWLKAGYVENQIFHPTKSGTPQGGVISPLLANIALHGLGELLASYNKVKIYQSSPKAKRQRITKQKLPKYGFCRYADDFIITAETQEDLESILPTIRKWMVERGLQLNEEKTHITKVSEGFNFLGFHIRQFNGHCITKPEKKKTLEYVQGIRDWLKRHKDIPVEEVITHLNPVIKGWANYYRFSASKRVFGYVDTQIWKALWKWACRRHPNKGKKWIAHKYFTVKDGWKLKGILTNRRGKQQPITLSRMYETPIVRHIQVKGTNSPDNPELKSYWEQRRTKFGKTLLAQGSRLYQIANKQHWKCPQCGEHLYNGEELHQHHHKQIKDGGLDFKENIILLHKSCHNDIHSWKGV